MKKCAVINDISGFGKCSLTAAIPILSSLGIQVNPVVTGVFTNQTGYSSYKCADLTDMLPEVIGQWKKLNPRFDGILTGFLLNSKQYEYVEQFIDTFKSNDTVVLVDPVMADDGILYKNFTDDMVEGVKRLINKADIITPNLTELKILSGEDDINSGAKKLIKSGINTVIVTGIVENGFISSYVFSKDTFKEYRTKLIKSGASAASFSGTGDIFSSFVMGKILNGCSIFDAAEQAVNFIGHSISHSNINDRNDGIDFEPFLKDI